MKVSVIGCGLIGEKRTKSLGNHELVFAADINIEKAKKICDIKKQGKPTVDWREAINSDSDIIVVSVTNELLTPIGIEAYRKNKHVIIEKPAARSLNELKPFYELSKRSDKKVKVGFNHRYHPALRKAKEIFDSGEIGDLMFIRARYGHGGRLGYEKEWRANPDKSGGGELIDQGVHLIDLSRWFFGEFEYVDGFADTLFWNMPVEDNGFVILRTEKKQTAWLHASCTEWKNMFCFEIYGKYGKLQIDGLGGSYGVEKLTYYKMLPQMGPPETTMWEYPGPDNSWQQEFDGFIDSIQSNKPVNGDLHDAYKALEVVDRIYKRIS